MSEAGLRVLQFCHSYDGPFLDCARQYASLFVGTSYRVTTVYLTGAPDDEVAAESASDEVIFLGYNSEDVGGLKLKAIRDLKRIVAERDFRFCIAHRAKPTYVALMATKLPVISVHHAFGDLRRCSRRALMTCFRHRLTLLGVSDAVRDDLRASLPGWPPEKIQTLYNRLDLAAVEPTLQAREAAREVLHIPQDAWVVGNVGRLHPDKDQATLLRGFAKALPQLPPQSLLVIAGSGRLEQELKALAASLDIAERVRFLGQVPGARRYFRAFDVFALSSDHEPFGMVLLEAMAAGVPIIASDCGGACEVVHGVGKLFPLGDVSALATALIASSNENAEDAASSSRQVLTERFSDAAVRRDFWNLPTLAAYRDT